MPPRLLNDPALGRKAKSLLRKLNNAVPRQRISAAQFETWRTAYNESIGQAQAATRRAAMDRKNEKARAKRALAKTPQPEKQKTFIIHATVQTTYNKKYHDKETGITHNEDSVVVSNKSSSPITGYLSDIAKLVNTIFEVEDSWGNVIVINYRVEVMKDLTRHKNPQRAPMRRAYVLRNDWLRYSHGIANIAYDDSGGRCVYTQLTEYLLNPPTGNPTKFIAKQRTSEEALFSFFKYHIFMHNLEKEYPDFTVDSGVSSELIRALCLNIKRNMYAYDENDKVFDSLCTQSSKNYAPIVFYKLHGHFYLINDSTVMRSVAESNKTKGANIVSVLLTDEFKQKQQNVYIIDAFNVAEAASLPEGVHLVRQSNLDNEVIDFIKIHKSIPLTRTTNSSITEISYELGLQHNTDKQSRKYVKICVDATHAETYTYDQLKKVADCNDIQYTNEGVGSVILKILDNARRTERAYLTNDDRREFLLIHDHTCAICKIKCEYLEIDHILPLAAGGTNDMHNLRPLCSHCHKQKTTEEKITGAYEIRDPEISVFNKIAIENVLPSIKTWQFVEKTYNEPENEDSPIFKTDMRKCRRNIAYHSTYSYPVFCVMDNPRTFSGTIQCGLFYVETNNTYPFRGCGWYSQPLIEYGLSKRKIKLCDIKLEFIPSTTLPADHFKTQIDTLLTAFATEPTLQKLAVNSLVGIFGRTKQSAAKTKFTMCEYEAAEWFGAGKNDEYTQSNIFIRTIELDNDDNKLYQGIFSEPVQMEGLKYPIYKQILEMEAIQLHTLEQSIRDKGGVILDRNTDAIRYTANKEIILTDEWTPGNPKYQTENPKPLKIEVLPHLCRNHNLNYDNFELNWNVQYDYSGTAEQEAKRIIDANTSIHIDGRAGTGKTYLINAIRAELNNRNAKFTAFSPTNKGARLVGGQTIHSIYFKYKTSKKKMFTIMQPLQYIFIDEVSMMIADFYQLFTLIKRTFPHIKFIIAGDFGQLPPVADSWTGNYENSPALYSLCDGQRIQLTTCRRSDDALFKLCTNVQSVDINQFAHTQHTYLNLAYTHSTRIKINKLCMARFIDEHKPSRVVNIPRDKLNPKTQDVLLAVGVPVIAHTTNKKLKFLNSQTFIITHITDSHIQLKNDSDDVLIKHDEFHKYFYPGFCITYHASQGETFKEKYTIHDWHYEHVCDKAKYVALSRGTNIHNIQIRS